MLEWAVFYRGDRIIKISSAANSQPADILEFSTMERTTQVWNQFGVIVRDMIVKEQPSGLPLPSTLALWWIFFRGQPALLGSQQLKALFTTMLAISNIFFISLPNLNKVLGLDLQKWRQDLRPVEIWVNISESLLYHSGDYYNFRNSSF